MPEPAVKPTNEDFPLSFAIGIVLFLGGLVGCIVAEAVDHSDSGAVATLSVALVGGIIMVVGLAYRIGHNRP